MIETISTPVRGYKTQDGKIFTGQPVFSEVPNVTRCASDAAAREMAEQHQRVIEAAWAKTKDDLL